MSGRRAFTGCPDGDDEGARAGEHRLHLRDGERPARELREIAVPEKFAEHLAVGGERAVRASTRSRRNSRSCDARRAPGSISR